MKGEFRLASALHNKLNRFQSTPLSDEGRILSWPEFPRSSPLCFNPRPSVMKGEFVSRRTTARRRRRFNPRPSVMKGEFVHEMSPLHTTAMFQSTPLSDEGRIQKPLQAAGALLLVSIHAPQ